MYNGIVIFNKYPAKSAILLTVFLSEYLARGGKMMIIEMKGANIFSAPMFILAHI